MDTKAGSRPGSTYAREATGLGPPKLAQSRPSPHAEPSHPSILMFAGCKTKPAQPSPNPNLTPPPSLPFPHSPAPSAARHPHLLLPHPSCLPLGGRALRASTSLPILLSLFPPQASSSRQPSRPPHALAASDSRAPSRRPRRRLT
ncbi:hypothetical protein BS78_07G081900 [Paspalum vaginatum]|nr:hypothetical protein BS78_07G081900 [Paspalum vaginatum]